MALAGVFISATAANTRPTGARAFIARGIVTLAVAFVASEALRQVQQPLRAAPAGSGEEGGMASLLALVSAATGKAPGCENPVAAGNGAEGEGEGMGDAACLEVSCLVGHDVGWDCSKEVFGRLALPLVVRKSFQMRLPGTKVVRVCVCVRVCARVGLFSISASPALTG